MWQINTEEFLIIWSCILIISIGICIFIVGSILLWDLVNPKRKNNDKLAL